MSATDLNLVVTCSYVPVLCHHVLCVAPGAFSPTAPPPPPPPPAPRAGDEPVAPTSSLHSLMGAPRAPIGKVTVEPAKQLTLEEKTEIMDSRTRSWEQAHQVLGHNSRSNLRRCVGCGRCAQVPA